MRYSIEKPTTKDTEELLALSRKVTNTNSRKFLLKDIVDAFLGSTIFNKEIVENIEHMTIIKNETIIIGLCVFVGNQLQTLMIDPDYQNKGIATYFLQHLEKTYFTKYEELRLECFAPNIKANYFYKKNNWVKYDTILDENLEIHKHLYKKRRDM